MNEDKRQPCWPFTFVAALLAKYVSSISGIRYRAVL